MWYGRCRLIALRLKGWGVKMARPIPCPIRIDCPPERLANNFPIRNLSSEAPDVPSEPIPIGGDPIPYVPPVLDQPPGDNPPDNNPLGGDPNNPTGQDCSQQLVVITATSSLNGDVKDYLNGLREVAPLCPDGCFWILPIPNALGVVNVNFDVNGFNYTQTATPGVTDDTTLQATILNFTPPECACNFYINTAVWGNNTSGWIDVKPILDPLLITGLGPCGNCCPDNPGQMVCTWNLYFLATVELLGDPSAPTIGNALASPTPQTEPYQVIVDIVHLPWVNSSGIFCHNDLSAIEGNIFHNAGPCCLVGDEPPDPVIPPDPIIPPDPFIPPVTAVCDFSDLDNSGQGYIDCPGGGQEYWEGCSNFWSSINALEIGVGYWADSDAPVVNECASIIMGKFAACSPPKTFKIVHLPVGETDPDTGYHCTNCFGCVVYTRLT